MPTDPLLAAFAEALGALLRETPPSEHRHAGGTPERPRDRSQPRLLPTARLSRSSPPIAESARLPRNVPCGDSPISGWKLIARTRGERSYTLGG
jgi:hypothetical protein